MKATLLRVTGSTVAVAGTILLSGGAVFAAEPSISNTGPGSDNTIKIENKCESTINNDTDVDITNNNPQDAESGESSAERNTTVGGVGSGNASNESSANFSVGVSNGSGSACATAPTASVTPPAVTPTARPEMPAGGRGGETVVSAAPEARQVAAPVGGVGAGSGDSTYFTALVTVTLASLAWFTARLRRHLTSFMA